MEHPSMTPNIARFGIVGLGKMGAGLARNAIGHGFSIVGVDAHPVSEELRSAGVAIAGSLAELVGQLSAPRFVMLYIPAGPAVDTVLDELVALLDAGDIVGDGGNSYWGDSIRRHRRARQEGIHFVDVGTSGGPGGARDGACVMVGGEREPVAAIEPILRKLAVEDGYLHVGGPGAGHFVKLVHNGIEFGMLQAIGEGMDLLTRYRETLAIADILHLWGRGSVIRSWLVELMEQMYRQQGGFDTVPPFVEDTGEVNWLVDDALHMEVPIPVITQSVVQLVASRDDRRTWARAVAMMRHGFGGHPFGEDAGIARERRTGRVGGFARDGE
jgi:6-phosphogluconate dehydrogenase